MHNTINNKQTNYKRQPHQTPPLNYPKSPQITPGRRRKRLRGWGLSPAQPEPFVIRLIVELRYQIRHTVPELVRYTVPMSRVTIEVWKCDDCGWKWIPESTTEPERCPSRKCRSTTWNGGKSEAKKASKMITSARVDKPVEIERAKVEREIPRPIERESPRVIEAVKAETKPAKLKNCPRCETETIPWGSGRRCMKCGRNWPLES